MKKYRYIKLLLVLLLNNLSVGAHDFAKSGIYYKITSSTENTVGVTYRGSSYDEYSNEYSGAVTLPESVTYNGKTYRVTSIGEYAFRDCTSLTSINIPNSITSISTYDTFKGCSGLEELILNVSQIDLWFNKNTTIKKVILGEDVKIIGRLAFFGCSSLTSINIPQSVTSIGSSAFEDCSSLTCITIPNVNYIAEKTFFGCKNLTSVNIPKSVTSIGDDAFYDCRSLTSITIPKSVTSIGDDAFYGCSCLYKVINNSNLPLSVGSDSHGRIAYYSKIVIEGSKLSTIGDFQFYTDKGIHYLTNYVGQSASVELPDNYNGENYEIFDYAFAGLSNPTIISIPYGVTSIGEGAFYNCHNLVSVCIPESVTSIAANAFYDNRNLESLNIPEELVTIGDRAFYGCEKIRSLTIPRNVTSIGKFAFLYCHSLSRIIVDSDNSVYDSREDCNAIIETGSNTLILGCSVTDIPESVISIGDYAFYGNKNLSHVTIPKGVVSIGKYAFYECENLVNITISEGLVSIAEKAFQYCNSLQRIINNSELSLSAGASDNGYIAYKASTILNGNSFTTIGDFQFKTTTAGKHYLVNYTGSDFSVVLPNNYNGENYHVDSYALYGHKINTLTIGSGILSIGANNFIEKPSKTIWLANTPPANYLNANGKINYVSNDQYDGLSLMQICSYLSSMFEVDGVRYVLLSPSERTCMAIDCAYNSTANSINISGTVSYRNMALAIKDVMPYSFYNNDFVKEVSISYDGNIGDYAFSDCDAVQTIDVSNQGVVGNGAFYFCRGVRTIKVSNHGDVYGSTFAYCRSVESIDISNQGKLGYGAFSHCIGMRTINIANRGDIEQSAFAGCVGRQTEINISNLGNIDDYAFTDYVGMKSLGISNKGDIGNKVFFNCCDLQTAIIKNDGVIGDEVFKGCSTLLSVSLGDKVTALGKSAFYGCESLQKIVVPNSVESMGEMCFYGCSKMESATMGEGLTSIGNRTFYGCKALTNVKLGNNINTINNMAFGFCTQLPHINLPESLVNMNDSVFYTCSALEEMTIPQATISVGNHVFTKCSKLSDIIIKERSNSLNLGNSGNLPLFVDCPLDSVYIGGKIAYNKSSEYGYSPFHNNKSLRTVVIADSEEQIYEREFEGCSNLQNITIGDGVLAIGTYAFSACTSLPTISIPQSAKSIGDYAFSQCEKLSDVIIKNRTNTITLGHNGKSPLFVDCPLDSVYIGGKISYSRLGDEGYSPFYRNTTLRTVLITDKEEQVYENEFYGCTGLKKVIIGNGVTSIGDYAFSGCSALESFSFGSSTRTIGDEAFSDCVSITVLISYATEPPICGIQALDDISKWDCTLYVPSGYASVYYGADKWKDFFFIEDGAPQIECYVLTYMVDGEVYCTETLAYGSIVTMLEEPVKEGYVFSGWDKILTAMPAENVVINGSFTLIEAPTSVNITINQYGCGTYCSEYALNFSEVVGLKAYAATGYDTENGVVTLSRVMTAKAGVGLFIKGKSGEYIVPIMENTSFNTLNMLVGTLENTELNGTSGDGLYANYKFTIKEGDTEPMFYLFADGSTLAAERAYLQIPTMWLSQAESKAIRLRFVNGETTDIGDIESTGNNKTVIYDLMGLRVENPTKGCVYIVNGKKIVY